MRKKPRIYLDRDSVCMGDDMTSHDEEWIIRPEHDLLILLNLCKKEFLPTNIQGANPGWRAMWNGKAIAIIGQSWQSAKIIELDLTLEKIKDENGETSLFFEYLRDENPENVFTSTKNA